MAIAPARTKYRKAQKGSRAGQAKVNGKSKG